jgi:hypothetical protein
MAHGTNVMAMLCPQGGWTMIGEDFDTAQFLECEPITKAQYEAGFAQYDAWKAEQNAQAVADKAAAQAKLEALGLTANDLKALGL